MLHARSKRTFNGGEGFLPLVPRHQADAQRRLYEAILRSAVLDQPAADQLADVEGGLVERVVSMRTGAGQVAQLALKCRLRPCCRTPLTCRVKTAGVV